MLSDLNQKELHCSKLKNMFKKNRYNLLCFLILCCPPLILLAIYSPSTKGNIAFAETVIILISLCGYFSVGKSVRTLQALGKKDISQDLVINGIRMNLTVK